MILNTNILKQIVGSSVKSCTELTLREVVNIVGMVGAGKSTLIKVLAFWCHQNGYRIAIVVDTVAEVLNLQKYLSAFGVAVSPLIGRNERLKYINQVTQPNETCLSTGFSQYLTPVCLIDGMDTQHSAAIAFGKEPCYSLKRETKITCVLISISVWAQGCSENAILLRSYLQRSRDLRHPEWGNSGKHFWN